MLSKNKIETAFADHNVQNNHSMNLGAVNLSDWQLNNAKIILLNKLLESTYIPISSDCMDFKTNSKD